jgi:hypothetical protein
VVSVQLHAPAVLRPGKQPALPTGQKIETVSRSARCEYGSNQVAILLPFNLVTTLSKCFGTIQGLGERK